MTVGYAHQLFSEDYLDSTSEGERGTKQTQRQSGGRTGGYWVDLGYGSTKPKTGQVF